MLVGQGVKSERAAPQHVVQVLREAMAQQREAGAELRRRDGVVLHVLGEDHGDGRRRLDGHRRAGLGVDERLVSQQDQVGDEPLPRSLSVGEHEHDAVVWEEVRKGRLRSRFPRVTTG